MKTAGRAAKNGRKTGRKSRGEQDGGQEGRKKTALFGCKTLADNGLCNKKSSFQTHETGARCIGPNKNIAPAGQKLRAAQQKPSDIRWERMVAKKEKVGWGRVHKRANSPGAQTTVAALRLFPSIHHKKEKKNR